MVSGSKMPAVIPNVDRMIEYCTGVADEFLARLNRVRSFVPDHNLTSGTANEMILRDFLSEFSTGKFAVGQGFICDPAIPDNATEHLVSKQCDVIVYDRDYPLVHSEGDIKVVWPHSVRMFVEIKTELKKREIEDALDKIFIAKQVPYMNLTPGLIFAFKSSRVGTVIKNLRKYPIQLSAANAPSAILLLDEGVIIHRWSPVESESHVRDVYEVRKGDTGEKAIVVAFLLMFFLDVLMDGVFGGSSVANMLYTMIKNKTKKILGDFRIGDHASPTV